MPRNASGVYTLPAGNPVVTGTTISSAWANNTFSDVGSEMTNSLDRSGRGGMLAPFRGTDGSNAAPAFSFTAEVSTGLYRSAAGAMNVSILGASIGSFQTTGWNGSVVGHSSLDLPLTGGTLSGDITAPNFWVGALTTSAGTFGVQSNNGSSMVAWGSAAAGAGRMEFYFGAAKQFDIGAVASSVNFIRASGAVTGSRAALSSIGTDTNVGMIFQSQGSGDFVWSGNGGTQLQVNSTASSTRFITVAGSNGGNPSLSASAGFLGVLAAMRESGAGSTAADVASSYTLYASDKICFVDSSRTANNRQIEWNFASGVLTGRFVNDAYGAATNWLGVTGGQSAGVTSIVFSTGASVTALSIDNAQKSSFSGIVAASAAAGSVGLLQLIDSSAGAGVNIKLTGDGGVTPSKYLRVTGGALQVVNSAYGAVILSLSDAGVLTDTSSNEYGYRRLPAASVTTGAFVAADSGKLISATAGVTAPNSTMVAGDVVTIYNTTAGNITITATVATLTQVGTAATGNRTLAAKGLCTIIFLSGTNAIISGTGLT